MSTHVHVSTVTHSVLSSLTRLSKFCCEPPDMEAPAAGLQSASTSVSQCMSAIEAGQCSRGVLGNPLRGACTLRLVHCRAGPDMHAYYTAGTGARARRQNGIMAGRANAVQAGLRP